MIKFNPCVNLSSTPYKKKEKSKICGTPPKKFLIKKFNPCVNLNSTPYKNRAKNERCDAPKIYKFVKIKLYK